MKRVLMLAVLVCGCVFRGETARAGLDEALEARAQGNYPVALKEFSALADKGDDRAMVTIGCWYLNGDGFPRDYAAALDWFLRAHEAGNADAASNLGVMYRDGLGVPQDFTVAQALFGVAVEKARTDDTLGRVRRNLEKLDVWISERQLSDAKKLGAKGVSAKRLREFNKGNRTTNGLAVSAVGDLWSGVPATYSTASASNGQAFDPAKVTVVRVDGYNEMPGGVGFTSEQIENPGRCVSNGIYTCPRGRFSIRIPSPDKNGVEVHESRVGDMQCDQVRFFEPGADELEPWSTQGSGWHAAAVTTCLPGKWKGDRAEALKRLEEMQMNFLADIPSNLYHCATVDGPLGPAIQTVVLNRKQSAYYPQTAPKLNPLRHGVETIGVNRSMYMDRVIVELGIIVPRPRKMDDTAFLRYAIGQMDCLMAGFTLLPEKTSGE